jgi:hypothetical protein
MRKLLLTTALAFLILGTLSFSFAEARPWRSRYDYYPGYTYTYPAYSYYSAPAYVAPATPYIAPASAYVAPSTSYYYSPGTTYVPPAVDNYYYPSYYNYGWRSRGIWRR